MRTVKIDSLEELLVLQLREIHSAEKYILNTLPGLTERATDPALKAMLQAHVQETRDQLDRLQELSKLLNQRLSGGLCVVMRSLTEEAAELVREIEPGGLLDTAIIGACQRIEHHEMAAYATARIYAEQMGREDIIRLLDETLEEEKAAQELLARAVAFPPAA